MSLELFLRYIGELKWPLTIIILLIIFRKTLARFLTSYTLGSKVKISLFGVEVETTLRELEDISIATLGGTLNNRQQELLTLLSVNELIKYEKGVPEDEWDWIVPLRNAGIIETQPRGAYLRDAQSLKLTALGLLMVKAIKAQG
jgi:hypothetical protein